MTDEGTYSEPSLRGGIKADAAIHGVFKPFWIASLALAMTVIFAAITPAFALCEAPGTADLIHHWKLDETSGSTANDSAGLKNGTWDDGAGNDMAQETTAGIVGTALNFDGVDDDITVTAFTIPDIATIAMWVKFDTTVEQRFFGTGANYEIFKTAGGIIDADIFEGGGSPISTLTVTTGRWYHIAVSYDKPANVAKLYIDGVLEDTGNASSLAEASPGTLDIGARNGSGNELDGTLDDVRIYGRVLSDTEINALYNLETTASAPAGQIAFNTSNAQMIYCDGTDWRMMGTGSYNPNAIYFDGTNDYLITNAMTGDAAAYNNKFTLSTWMNIDPNASEDYDVFYQLDDAGRSQFVLTGAWSGTASDDLWQVRAYLRGPLPNSDVIDALSTSTNRIAAGQWHHVLISGDASLGKVDIFINDALNEDSGQEYTSATGLFVSDVDHAMGGTTAAINRTMASYADFWLDIGTYIDFTIEANRRKFISAGGMPMYLGADGSLPTGAVPDIFLSGDTANWHTNKGTGGGFTENGAITSATTQPGDIVLSSGIGYFVEINPGLGDANLSGISGAAATCLSTLQSSSWLGKTNAQANNLLQASHVRPWLCTDTVCNNLIPGRQYAYASTVNAAAGGALMTATVEGYTEDDGRAYENATAFGASGLREYHTGRTQSNQPASETCNNWTSGSPLIGNNVAVSDTADYGEKLSKYGSDCDIGVNLICIVDPPGCHPLGEIQYNSGFNVMEYCNGIEWVPMGEVGGTPPTNGLIGHWTLDETSGTSAADSSASLNNGTLQAMNVPSVWQPGILSGSLKFESGSDDWIDIGNVPEVKVPLPVTIAGWVKPDNLHEPITLFHSDFTTSGYRGYFCFVSEASNGDIVATIGGDNDGTSATIGFGWGFRATKGGSYAGLISIGVWSHVSCVIRAANDMSLYVNGIDVGGTYSGTVTTMLYGTGVAGINAHDSSASSDTSHGAAQLDDIRVYNRGLSQTEVQQLYHYGLSNGLGDVSGNCTNPTMAEGAMFYNGTHNTMQYCNGERWVGIGK